MLRQGRILGCTTVAQPFQVVRERQACREASEVEGLGLAIFVNEPVFDYGFMNGLVWIGVSAQGLCEGFLNRHARLYSF